MDRRLTLGLAGALGVALLVIAFLLGRQSGGGTTPATVVVMTPAAAGPAPVGSGSEPAAALAPPAGRTHAFEGADPGTPVPALDVPAPAAAAPETVLPTSAPPPPGAPAADPLRAEVARYFAELDVLEADAKKWSGDPEAVARAIVNQAVEGGGGSSELDGLLSSTRGALSRMQGLSVPAPCAEHHRRSVELVQESVRLMEQVRDGLASGGAGLDASGLAAMTTTGREIERRAKELDLLGADLKKRYGV